MFPELITFSVSGHTFTIYFYGLFLLLAIILGVLILYRELKRRRLETHRILDNIFWIILGGLVGARLGYVLLHWSFFFEQPLEIFRFWHGGLTFSGGLVGGLVVVILWLWARGREELWGWLDSAMIAVVLGHAVGMLGSFFTGLDRGQPTELPWGISLFMNSEDIVRHPTQFYELGGYLVVGLALILISRRSFTRTNSRIFPGFILFSGLATTSFIRFLVEFVRMPEKILITVNYVGISSAHLSSLILCFCGIIGLWWCTSKVAELSSLTSNKTKKMDQEKIAEFKKKLEEKKNNLEKQLTKIAKKDKNLKDDYDAKFENFDSEVLDISNEASEVSTYQNRLSLEANLELQLRDVKQSLARVAKGTYGQCTKCNGEIKEERLEALPQAQLCLKCSN